MVNENLSWVKCFITPVAEPTIHLILFVQLYHTLLWIVLRNTCYKSFNLLFSIMETSSS